MAGGERRAVPPQHVALDATAVNAPHDDAAELFRNVLALEHEQAGMGPAALLVMRVIANLVEQPIRIWIETAAGLPLVGAAGNHVEQVRNDAAGEETLPVAIEIHAPGVARPLGKDIETLLRQVVAPDRRIHLHAIDFRLREDAVQAVELAVRAPLKGVECFVRVLTAETLEQNFAAVTLARAVGVFEKEKIGRRTEKDAAVADLDAAGHVEAVVVIARWEVLPLSPDRDFVRLAVAVRILQNLDPVARPFPWRRAFGILEALDHPEPAALIDGERDRIDDVRLGREHLDFPPRRHLEALDGFFRRQVRLAGRLAVVEAKFTLSAEGRHDRANAKG